MVVFLKGKYKAVRRLIGYTVGIADSLNIYNTEWEESGVKIQKLQIEYLGSVGETKLW